MGSGVATTANKTADVEPEKGEVKCCHTKNEKMLAQERKYSMKDIVENELNFTVHKFLDFGECMGIHNTQSCIWSGMYNVFDQVVLIVLFCSLNKEALDVHEGSSFNHNAAPDRVSMKFLPSN